MPVTLQIDLVDMSWTVLNLPTERKDLESPKMYKC